MHAQMIARWIWYEMSIKFYAAILKRVSTIYTNAWEKRVHDVFFSNNFWPGLWHISWESSEEKHTFFHVLKKMMAFLSRRMRPDMEVKINKKLWLNGGESYKNID